MPETFFPQAQLVCLLPVATFNYVTFTWNVCFSAMPVNQLNLVLIYMKLSAWPLKQDLYYHSFYYFIQFWNKFVQFELTIERTFYNIIPLADLLRVNGCTCVHVHAGNQTQHLYITPTTLLVCAMSDSISTAHHPGASISWLSICM